MPQIMRKAERALFSIFGAASGCATVVSSQWNQHFIIGREHSAEALYTNWQAALNIRSSKHWRAMATMTQSRLTWFESQMEMAARNALFCHGQVNVLKTDDQQDVNVYRAQIETRISRDRLRHFVAEKFPSLRIRNAGTADEEVVLRSRTDEGLILGGAVWGREYFANGSHLISATMTLPKVRVRPPGADTGGGRWWYPG
jgi:hypothetical protein